MMNKYIVALILISICYINAYSQVQIAIEELTLSNIRPCFSDNIIDESETEGPFIFLDCCITNLTDNDVYINPSNSKLIIKFNYNGEEYSTELIAYRFMENDTLIIEKGCKQRFNVESNILLGTPMWSENKEDYSLIMLGLLPTIQIKYYDPYIELNSCGIQKVNVKK